MISPAPEEKFIRVATAALQRMSKSKHGQSPSIQPWTLTSLEVAIHHEEKIGKGSFGMLYRGEWDGKASPSCSSFCTE